LAGPHATQDRLPTLNRTIRKAHRRQGPTGDPQKSVSPRNRSFVKPLLIVVSVWAPLHVQSPAPPRQWYVPNFRDHVADTAAGACAHRVDPVGEERVALEVLASAPHVQRHHRGTRRGVPRDVPLLDGVPAPFRGRPALALLEGARRPLAPLLAARVGRHRRLSRFHLGCNLALTDRVGISHFRCFRATRPDLCGPLFNFSVQPLDTMSTESAPTAVSTIFTLG
jgi:hypothetical protein